MVAACSEMNANTKHGVLWIMSRWEVSVSTQKLPVTFIGPGTTVYWSMGKEWTWAVCARVFVCECGHSALGGCGCGCVDSGLAAT